MRSNKRLIVEGPDDLHSVVGLMRAHVNWPRDKEDAPVWIETRGGADEILEADYLSAQIKAPTVQTLGIMLDADQNPAGRYQRLYDLCHRFFPDLPRALPNAGVMVDNDDGKRLGLWIMPDNASVGSLETFLRLLVPGDGRHLLDHAEQSLKRARALGAGWRDCHFEKALLYTWLAWPDPPGQSPGIALTRRVLDPCSQTAVPFVQWFRNLYSL